MKLLGISLFVISLSIGAPAPNVTLPTMPPIPVTLPVDTNNLTDPKNLDKLKKLADNETIEGIKDKLEETGFSSVLDLEGEVFCPKRMINAATGETFGTSCGFNNFAYKLRCCGDKNSECCWSIEIWVYVVGGLIILLTIGSTILSIALCLGCCVTKAVV